LESVIHALTPVLVTQSESFFERARHARKLLVLDLGFLGDTVHLIPALWEIRCAWPQAELHVMVADHVMQLLNLTPWVDHVWGYPRFPQGPKPWQDYGRVLALRNAKFDVVINLNGSDRSSLLTWLSGAALRLGRRPQGGGPLHWPLQFTHTVNHAYHGMPVYKQRWNCLRLAGIPCGEKPDFHTEISAAARRNAGIQLEDDGRYLHISPFTTQDHKELPREELVSLISLLQTPPDHERDRPYRVILSCAPTQRERDKMTQLVSMLSKAPWRVFSGTLDVLALSSVLAGSFLHFGGDSGSLHLALMAGVPTISWFRRYDGMKDWMPSGELHRTLVGSDSGNDGINGISGQALAYQFENLVHLLQASNIELKNKK
jgi:ADP-heptose:LPS heptosyltransferase